ncbi:MAG: phosphatase PAP2 family protein [Neisseriaceae bacterium]
MSRAFRAWALFSAWGFVGLCYSIGALWAERAGVTVQVYQTWLDDATPFWVDGWLVYASFFVLVPYAFFSSASHWIRPLRLSMQYAALAALVMYLLWPSSMVYPEVVGETLNQRLWLWLHEWDTTGNCLPSLHVVLATLCGLALGQSHQGKRRLIELLWVAMVIISVLLLKRHLWLDVASGLALALVAAKGGGLWGRRDSI